MDTPQTIILVVEDNDKERFVLRHLLDSFNYTSHIVPSGEEAILAIGSNQYAAVLMNITLPGMDGFECTKHIRQLEGKSDRRTPIIALTAREVGNDHAAALNAGADAYLTKPLEVKKLRDLLGQIVARD